MQRSLIIKGARLWNELPVSIRDVYKQSTFKKLFYNFLF